MSKQARPPVSSAQDAAAVAFPHGSARLGAAALAASLALGIASVTAAQDVSPPEVIERSEPAAPTNSFGMPLEGWVKVRYTVRADGSTADVRIADVMPPQLNTRAVTGAVQSWRFTPATASGEPVDWYNNESYIVFDADNVPLEPSPMFAQAYAPIVEAIEAQDFDRAKRQNETLLESRAMRLNEIGLAQYQAAMLHAATSDYHDAHAAILRATDPEVRTLPDADLANALRYRFGIEVELGHYASSLETFDRLAAIEQLADDDALKTHADAVRAALSSDGAVAVKGRAGRNAPWSYAPRRRTFGFTDVEGNIRGLELECDRRKQPLDFAADVEWSIPESWGDCTLFVDARRDATFTLIEFPTAAAAP